MRREAFRLHVFTGQIVFFVMLAGCKPAPLSTQKATEMITKERGGEYYSYSLVTGIDRSCGSCTHFFETCPQYSVWRSWGFIETRCQNETTEILLTESGKRAIESAFKPSDFHDGRVSHTLVLATFKLVIVESIEKLSDTETMVKYKWQWSTNALGKKLISAGFPGGSFGRSSPVWSPGFDTSIDGSQKFRSTNGHWEFSLHDRKFRGRAGEFAPF